MLLSRNRELSSIERTMNKYITGLAAAVFALSVSVHAQKGVDSQTKTIKDDSNKVTSRTSDASRTFDWGRGKTKVRELLPNPYRLASRRDVLVQTIIDTLREKRIIVDEAASRPQEGLIVTQPFVFAKGTVVTQNELNRYGELDSAVTSWTRAQYTLTIEVQSIDGVQNNVTVNAKVEGRAGNGLISEWVTVRSSGVAEDEFLAKLVETVTGVSPDPKQDGP
jgi:hypothetical protein